LRRREPGQQPSRIDRYRDSRITGGFDPVHCRARRAAQSFLHVQSDLGTIDHCGLVRDETSQAEAE
jgi:hypothetical protein